MAGQDMTSERTAHRGILVPDPRLEVTSIWDAETTLAHDAEEATGGRPEPAGAYALALAQQGAPRRVGLEVEVVAHQSGLPGATAGYRYQYEDDPAPLGWDPPMRLAEYQVMQAASGTIDAADPAIIRLQSGALLAAWDHRGPGSPTVAVMRLETDGTLSSRITAATLSGAWGAGRGAHPALHQLEDGRVLLAHWRQLSTGDCQVVMRISEDDGDTWSIITRSSLPVAVPYQAAAPGASSAFSRLGRLALGGRPGELLLLAHVRAAQTDTGTIGDHAVREGLVQWASSDGGATWTLIRQTDDEWTVPRKGSDYTALRGGYPAVVVRDGVFFVFFVNLELDAGTTLVGPFVRVARLGSAYQHYGVEEPVYLQRSPTARNEAGEAALSTYDWTLTDGDLAAVMDPTGSVYVVHRWLENASATGEGVIAWSGPPSTSLTAGDWRYLGSNGVPANGGTWWSCGDAATFPQALSVCWHEGAVYLACTHVASPGTGDASITLLQLGSWATPTLPPLSDDGDQLADRVSPSLTWLPFDLPQDVGAAASGAGTETLTVDGLQVVTAANDRTYTWTLSTTPDYGAWVETIVTPATGSAQQLVGLRLGDGVDDHRSAVRVSASDILLVDQVSGSTIGSVTVDTTAGVVVRLAQAGASAKAWYRPRGFGRAIWTLIGQTTTLTPSGAPTSDTELDIGRTVAGASDVTWHGMIAGEGQSAAVPTLLTQTMPSDLLARPLATAWDQVHGFALRATGGPVYAGQSWTLAPAWVHGVEQLWSRSPSRGWRPTDGDVLTLRVPGAAAPHWSIRGHVMVQGAGWALAIEGYTGSAWDSIGTLTSAVELGQGTLGGDVLAPTGLPATRPGRDVWYTAGELRGWWVSITDGANQVLAPILHQPEGRWEQGAEIPLRLHLDRDRTVVVGARPASGTVTLYSPQAAFIHQRVTTDYSAWRYTVSWLPLTTVPDELLEIGRLVAGEIWIAGQEYGWGRQVVTYDQLEEQEAESTQVLIRSLSAPIRTVRLDWTDGVDLTQIQRAEASPDHVGRNQAGDPIASLGGTSAGIEGLKRELAARRSQVVYLPRVSIPATSAGTQSLWRREDIVLGRVLGDTARENVMGDEGTSELERLAALTIREEV